MNFSDSIGISKDFIFFKKKDHQVYPASSASSEFQRASKKPTTDPCAPWRTYFMNFWRSQREKDYNLFQETVFHFEIVLLKENKNF